MERRKFPGTISPTTGEHELKRVRGEEPNQRGYYEREIPNERGGVNISTIVVRQDEIKRYEAPKKVETGPNRSHRTILGFPLFFL